MSDVKRLLFRMVKWPHFGLVVLVLLTLGLHLITIMKPPDLVFDEQHYIGEARSIINGEGVQRGEHPPLARLLITVGVRLFGDNPFGWRLPPAVFGTLCIIFFYFICRGLHMAGLATLLATFLFSLENMTFLQASVAMLDIYNLTFMLAAFLLYIRRSYLASGLAAGLGTLAKLTGALAMPVIFIDWLFSGRPRFRMFVALVILAPAAFFSLLPTFDLLTAGQLIDPVTHIRNMLSQSGSLTFGSVTHSAASRPWEWVIKPLVMFYWYDPHYIGAISFNVWAFIVPAFVYMLFLTFKRNRAALFGVAWFAGTYLLWIPMSIITDRISYVYYFYPTIGAICIGLGLGLAWLLDFWRRNRRSKRAKAALSAVGIYLAAHVAVFVMLSPVFAKWISVIPVPV